MKIKKYNLIPFLLLVYLLVMAYLGLDSLRDGTLDTGTYIIVFAVTLGCIWLLRRNLIKRSRRRSSGRNEM